MTTIDAKPRSSTSGPIYPQVEVRQRRWLDVVLVTLVGWFTRPAVLRPIFAVLRWFPRLRIHKLVVLSRHADVLEALRRDEDFGFDPAFSERVERLNGPFVLGMDSSPQYRQEMDLLHRVIRPEDLPRIHDIVTHCANEVVETARPVGRIEAVDGLARVVVVRLVAAYFGLAGPDEATMMRWTGAILNYLFLGIAPRTASQAAAELHRHVRWLILERKAAIESGENVPDDVLTRLVMLQDTDDIPWLDNDVVARNLVGLVVETVEETTKAVVHAVAELLRRPVERDRARQAALAGDIDTVRQYAFEALRFRPVNATVAPRHCKRETTIGNGWRIPEGSMVLVATMSAMFDRNGYAHPRRFRANRPVEDYLHFSYGRRACLGSAINYIVIPELVAAVLRLPNVRRARGRDGRPTYDGVVPERLLLTFDPMKTDPVRFASEHDRAAPQTVLSIVTMVQPGKAKILAERLREIDKDLESNPYIPLSKLEMLHFASFAVLTSTQGSVLVFESNFDGFLDAYLDALIVHASGLDDIFGCCAGYPWEGAAHPERVKAYLRSHVVRPSAYHVGNTGRTVAQIKAEAQLYDELQEFLDEELAAGYLPAKLEAIRARIQQFVAGRGDLSWALEPPPPRQSVSERLRHWSVFVVTLALGVPILLVLAPLWITALRRQECRDKAWKDRADHTHVANLVESEDLNGVQNHLVSLIPVKPGWIRSAALRVTLRVINLAARCLFTKGRLDGIPSIHFAHWALLNGGQHLLFLSNYDGSWESYLDDFIDKASLGLTAIWSNTSKFPHTAFLVFKGARDGPRFKEWARSWQTSTNVFYRAYPALTVACIDRHTAVRAGLSGKLSRTATRTWLRSL
jgi:cytochrome P450